MVARLFPVFDDVLRPIELAIVAQVLVEPLASRATRRLRLWRGQRLVQGGAEPAGGIERAHGLEAILELGEKFAFGLVEFTRLGRMAISTTSSLVSRK